MTTSFFALDYLRYLGFLRATAPATFDFAALLKLSDTFFFFFFPAGNLVFLFRPLLFFDLEDYRDDAWSV